MIQFRIYVSTLCLVMCLAGSDAVLGQSVDTATTFSSRRPIVAVRVVGRRVDHPERSYGVTHGMGGTVEGDRFALLAEEIKRKYPAANVYLVDWSAVASKKIHGIYVPWLVADSIEAVGDSAAQQLQTFEVDPQRLTLIGESFGNDVNHRIAAQLGEVQRILAFNPANEFGGGGALDLKEHCQQSWAFHTRSPFDTSRSVSHRGILLHTTGLDPVGQHTYGVCWLRETLAAGDATWLNFQREVPAGPDGMYDLGVLPGGEMDWEPAPRRLLAESSLAVNNATTTAKQP